ncbi:hypothetical protein ABTK02_23010, partial [Acinetobacter baumannii]
MTEWVRNPIVETLLPLSRRGYGAVGAGQALGLSPAASLALFAALALAAVIALRRALGRPAADAAARP